MQDSQEMQDRYEALSLRLERSESRLERSAKRFRVLGGLALTVPIGCLLLSTLTPATAQQTGGRLSLESRVTTLETLVAGLQTKLNNIQLTPGPQGPAGPAGAQGPQGQAGPGFTPDKIAILDVMSLSGTQLTLSGVNVRIVDGSGSTNSASGLGNLTIGYNQERYDGNIRTGSHNLILGDQNNYSSYGGLVAGYTNTISGSYASVSGGISNTASASYASVSGGYRNTASGHISSVSGGDSNTANSNFAWVSGGYKNTASGYYASVSGGAVNIASGNSSSVSGGDSNTASGYYASVSGGYRNVADGVYAYAP